MQRARDRVRREVTQAFLRARAAMLHRDLFLTTHLPQAEQALRATENNKKKTEVHALQDTQVSLERFMAPTIGRSDRFFYRIRLP